MQNAPRILSIPLAGFTAILLAGCMGDSPTSLQDTEIAGHANPGHCKDPDHSGCDGDGGGGGGDDGGGGGTSAIDVRFEQERAEDIATAAAQTLDGENSDELIQVEGAYTLTYSVQACSGNGDGEDDLIARFNETVLSGSAEITLDKPQDGDYVINDRVRVRLNDIFPGDGHRYSMRFHGLPTNDNSTFDPDLDVQVDELDSNGDGTVDETKVVVTNQELEVRKFRNKGKKILDTDRCFGLADYTFYATR